jgi:hypothetical protein
MLAKACLIMLLLFPVPAMAADAWICQLSGQSGIWQIDGGDLVAPASAGGARIPVLRNSTNSLAALSEELGGPRYELVVIDRRRMSIKRVTVGSDPGSEVRESGRCTIPDTRTAAVAQAAVGAVRPRIRELVRQAKSLADRGYTTSANLKLTEAAGFDRISPDEVQLISQMRQYVAAKPRR